MEFLTTAPGGRLTPLAARHRARLNGPQGWCVFGLYRPLDGRKVLYILKRIGLALWAYRGFIAGSVQREFQARYRQSLLGAAWVVLNPLAMIVVYTLVFSQLMRARLPGVDDALAYSVYLCAGILPWGLFVEITTRGVAVFIEQANLLKKLAFPRLCLPVVVVANALVNFAVIFGLFLLFLLLSGRWPGWALAWVLPVLAIEVTLATGLGVTLGVLNVFFRDVGQAFGIVIQFWFWLTPVVYASSALPEQVRTWLNLNPLTPLMSAYQGIFLYAQRPALGALVWVMALGLGLCSLGLWLFRRHAGELVDEL